MNSCDIIPLINRDALREGLLMSRRTKTAVGNAILIATGIPEHWWYRYTPSHIIGLTHDALIVRDLEDGRLKIGDALMEKGCQLTEIADWERGCIESGTKIMMGWPVGARPEHGVAASRYWYENVRGHDYDHVAIKQLLAKAVCGDWISRHVGLYSAFYCTEGVDASWTMSGFGSPLYPNINPTPGTMTKRYREKQIMPVLNAFTAEGLKYMVNLFGEAA